MTRSRLLLDTHIALWWFAGNPRLATGIREEIGRSECWLSAVSVWEVAIKFKLDKLPVAPRAFLGAARAGGFRLLPITPDHAAATVDLPKFHANPFDRLLLAQGTTRATDPAYCRCRLGCLWVECAPPAMNNDKMSLVNCKW